MTDTYIVPVLLHYTGKLLNPGIANKKHVFIRKKRQTFGIIFAYVVVVASGSPRVNVVIYWYCGNM